MGCCDVVDGNPEPFKKVSQRCCTDVICLAIFLVYTVAMVVIAIFSLQGGNIDYLMYPQDYTGQFCGKSSGVDNRTKAFFPRLDQDLLAQSAIIASPAGFFNFQPYTICVEECPEAFSMANPTKWGGPTYPGAAEDAPSYYATFKTQELFSRCLPVLQTGPSSERELCTLPACNTNALLSLGAEASCVTIDSQPTVTTAWEVTTSAGAALCDYQITEVVRSTFVPPTSDAESRVLERQFAEYISRAFSVLRSITDNWGVIVASGVGFPFACALVWFVLLYCFAGLIIALALTAVFFLLVAVTIFLYYKAGWGAGLATAVESMQNMSQSFDVSVISDGEGGLGQTWYAVLAVLSTICCLVYLLLLVLWRKAINRCIAIVREVTKVLFTLPIMMLWPLIGVGFHAGVLVYAVFIGGFILTTGQTNFATVDAALQAAANATGGDPAAADAAMAAFTSLDTEVWIAILLAVHIVGVIWAYWITELSVYTTLSRSTAVWYYSHGPKDGTGDVVQLGNFAGCGLMAVVSSAWCVFSRHLGSVAFAGAILTIFTVLRLILEAIAYIAKQKDPDNMMLKMAIKCTQCFLWCLEKTVQMVTYFGLIFVAIEGQYFCKACFSTFKCWSHYPAQVAVNKMVARVLSLVISLSIPVGCGLICYIWIEATGGHEPLYAAIFVGLTSWIIASCVTDVFRCAIDTVFICVFHDLEGKEGPMHMSKSLQKGFDVDESKCKSTRVHRDTIITKDSEKGVATLPEDAGTELARP